MLVFALREILALRRLAQLDDLRNAATDALAESNAEAASQITKRLERLYSGRTDLAKARSEIGSHDGDLLSAGVRLELVERALFKELDARAKRLVTQSASRVAVVTAVSPRALVDIGYVLFENMRLIRALAELYGGRPGFLGSARLASSVVGHLAMTGSIALGDSILQQVVGTGIATKMSARLGEGVVNGILTARIGISAMDLCRPMPFAVLKRPRIADFINPLTALSSSKSN